MIIHLTQGITRLALRIKETKNMQQLIDWCALQLLIQPGQLETNGYGPNGSPWVLTGCWPGKRTGVDIANPIPYDFPTICYDAYELDADGRVVFRLDKNFHCLPPGRYTGTLRVFHHRHTPINILPSMNLGREQEVNRGIPAQYSFGKECDPQFSTPPTPPPPTPPPPPPCCVLATFDIDLGPMCSDHIVDQIAVNFALNTCREEHGETS